MALTFEQWLESREACAEADIAASHPARDFDVAFKTLHVFADGAWFAELLNGDFWAIAGHDEFVGVDLQEAVRWLWVHHSEHENLPDPAPDAPGPRVIDLTPTWTETARVLIVLMENGNEEGRETARKEILRMGQILDAFKAQQGAGQ